MRTCGIGDNGHLNSDSLKTELMVSVLMLRKGLHSVMRVCMENTTRLRFQSEVKRELRECLTWCTRMSVVSMVRNRMVVRNTLSLLSMIEADTCGCIQ